MLLMAANKHQGVGDGLHVHHLPNLCTDRFEQCKHKKSTRFPSLRILRCGVLPCCAPNFETFQRKKLKKLTNLSFATQHIQHTTSTMAKGSKLLSALDNYKGVNHKLEHQKKQQKAAEKRKRSRAEDQEDEAVLEDAIKEAEKTVLASGKKDKKGAKRAKVEAEESDEEESGAEEWETDDEDKTHAVCCSLLDESRAAILTLIAEKHCKTGRGRLRRRIRL